MNRAETYYECSRATNEFVAIIVPFFSRFLSLYK